MSLLQVPECNRPRSSSEEEEYILFCDLVRKCALSTYSSGSVSFSVITNFVSEIFTADKTEAMLELLKDDENFVVDSGFIFVI